MVNPSEKKSTKKAVKKAVKKFVSSEAKAMSKNAKKKIKREIAATATNNTGARILRGQGDFFGDAVGGVKNWLGNGLRSGVDWLSNRAKGWLGSLFGSGDYHSRAIKMQKNTMWRHAPVTVVSDSNKPNFFRMREAIYEVQSSAGFQTRAFSMNPGLSSCFPWLSVIARNFTQYRVHGAILEYRSNINQMNSNSGGKVLLSVRYDLSQPAPTDVLEVENQAGQCNGRPMDNVLMPMECKPSLNMTNKYNLRSGTVPPDQALQLYDHCVFDITNIGQADASENIGTVYISYDVELLNPVLSAEDAPATGLDHFSSYDSSTVIPWNHNKLASTTLGGVWHPDTLTYDFPTANFERRYWVTLSAIGESGAFTGIASLTPANCAPVIYFSDNNAYNQSGYSSPYTSTQESVDGLIKVAANAAASVTIAFTAADLKGWGADLTVIPVPQGAAITKRERLLWDNYHQKMRDAVLETESECPSNLVMSLKAQIDSFRNRLSKLEIPDDSASQRSGFIRVREMLDDNQDEKWPVSASANPVPTSGKKFRN